MASPGTRTPVVVPEVALPSGNARPMPSIGVGSAAFPVVPETIRNTVLSACEVGFRHFDTAAFYMTEQPLGEAIAEAVQRGIIKSREEVFVTSKLWCTQCHPNLVLPSLRESLQNLQMEYVDLYLIHFPISLKPAPPAFPAKREDAVPFDFEGVWQAMEECQRLGLAKAIGVSNFTTKHLDRLLASATIPPAVNQVEMNPVRQQRKLREYCAEKGIHIAAYSPLGGQNWSGDGNAVMESDVLAEIAKARGKSIAQMATPSSEGPWDFCSHEENGSEFVDILRQLMRHLDYHRKPIFRGRKTQTLDQESWAMEVFLYAREGEFIAHTFRPTIPQSSCSEAVQDAARFACTRLTQMHEDLLVEAPFHYLQPLQEGEFEREIFIVMLV